MADRYVGLVALGSGDGSSAANCDNIADINTQLALCSPGESLILVNGLYSGSVINNVIPITVGSSGTPIRIRPQTPGAVTFRGNRADPWTVGAVDGDPFFRLDGVDNLTFEDLRFEDFGNGCFHVFAVETCNNIRIERCRADNVMRFVEVVGTVNGLWVVGEPGVLNCDRYSKGIVRVQGDTNDVHISDMWGDAHHLDGDPIPFGFQVTGNAHDVHYVDCRSDNNINTGSPYWNGDGFVSEELNYDITYLNCRSSGNADAAFDLKGSRVRLTNCGGDDNKRTFRLWGTYVILEDCWGTDPFLRGGIGSVNQVHVNTSGTVDVINGSFTGGGSDLTVFQTEPGSGRLVVTNTNYEIPSGGAEKSVGAGSTLTIQTIAPCE